MVIFGARLLFRPCGAWGGQENQPFPTAGSIPVRELRRVTSAKNKKVGRAGCDLPQLAPSNHGRDGTTRIAPAGGPLVGEKPRYPDAPIRPPHIALRGDGQAGLLLRPVRGLPWMVFGPRVPLRSTHGLRSYAASRLNGSNAGRPRPKRVHGADSMETAMKRGLPSAPLSGHLKFPATIGNN